MDNCRNTSDAVVGALALELKQTEDAVRSAHSLKQDLGMDSIAAVNVAFVLEEEFGIEIEIARGESFDSVADIVSIVERCLAADRQRG